jgi:AGCS family alanine or glycine:cation symporter
MDLFVTLFNSFRSIVWGPPLLILLLGTGIYLTFLLRGIQFRELRRAFSLMFKGGSSKSEGDISSFQALMTGLAGAIGTGNIAGIATAVTVGGFGALFWMWVITLLGMATSYAEALLAVKYRKVSDTGEISGGGMQTMERGLGAKWLAISFALFGSIAAFGIGSTVQSNSVGDALRSFYGIDPFWTGLVMMLITGFVVLGGIQSIGRVSGILVPFMALFYVVAGIIILIIKAAYIPEALSMIITSAFTGQAATGGFLGSTMLMAMQMGISRGVFSNESGLGSATFASSAAKTNQPVEQALLTMTGTFLSTMVVCTITGLVLAVTDVQGLLGPDGRALNGAPMAIVAFNSVLTGGKEIVLIGLALFAYSTVLAWAYYGEKCIEYLVGSRWIFPYRVIYTLLVLPGAILPLELIWAFADAANGLMALPNLVSILFLSQVVVAETNKYFSREKLPV